MIISRFTERQDVDTDHREGVRELPQVQGLRSRGEEQGAPGAAGRVCPRRRGRRRRRREGRNPNNQSGGGSGRWDEWTITSEVCTVKIAARPAHGNTMDVVLRTLQCLNDQMGEGDVSLVAMSTSDGDGGNGLTGAFLTMQLKVIHSSYSYSFLYSIF